MSKPMFAGIDGGGTKTAFVLVDEHGAVLARHTTSTSNAAVIGHSPAGEVLRAGLTAILATARPDYCLDGAWFGLSGSDRPEDQRQLRPFVEQFAGDIRLTNDAELVLGALPNGVGVAVVSGTGSIAFGRDAAGRRARAGGWGQIIGDEGSGYDLARRMFDAYARAVDGRGPDTSITARLMNRFSFEAPHQLIAWVYHPDTSKGDIASLSRIVVEEAEAGDAVASEIMRAAASELADTAAAVARRLGFTERLSLAVTGGMLTNIGSYREQVLGALRSGWPDLECFIVHDPALTAAQALARGYRSKGLMS